MANIKSAKKRILVDRRNAERNKAIKSKVKTAIKGVDAAIAAGDKYDVIDLGKDVPAETIIEAAKEHNADIIGLSALMTTTMMEMKKVVNLVKENNMDTLVIIGGAVITQGFADEIGADGYSEDAQNAVEVVGKLLAERDKNK